MNQILFSVCKYLPNIISDENINIGIVVHNPKMGEIEFIPSSSRKRILDFDDEMDRSELDIIFKYLEYEFSIENLKTKNLFNYIKNNDSVLLDSLLKNHVNHIQFNEIQSFTIDPTEEDSYLSAINTLRELYLYFDTPKDKRMDKQRILSLAKQNIRNAYGEKIYDTFSINFEPKQTLPYDIKFTNKFNTVVYYKSISFNYKNKNNLYKELKIFLYDLDEFLIKNPDFPLNNLYILINPTDFSSHHEVYALELLKEKGINVITLDEFYKDNSSTDSQFNELIN